MLPSKLDLTGRDLKSIQKEFSSFCIYLQAHEKRELTKEEIEHFNGDINGWINWFESLKK